MLKEKQKEAFNAFYSMARNNTVLEPRTTLMLHLCSAMVTGCYP